MAGEEGSLGPIGDLASYIGTTDNALRLLMSLFLGYPLGFFHRFFLYGKPPYLQHIYFIICGLGLCYFNFGVSVVHSAANILLIYVVLLVCGGTALSLAVAFFINMTYLCVGYYVTTISTDVYTVTWTTAHCVLTLRLIGLVADIYDGSRKTEELSAEQKETALKERPSLLEVAAHTYFFGGFLVGPQFPMKRYQAFVKGAFSDPVTGGLPASVTPALMRLMAGIAYTAVYQLLSTYLPDSYLVSPEFSNLSFPMRCLVILLWGKFTLYKYVACWLITEGGCILTGLTYNGKDENGNNLWDGCANIRIVQYETAMTCGDLVNSFNVNTNKWMAKYVFKRLKFLGNKDLSQVLTLVFLAVWHGLYTGYLINFSLEFLIIKFERQIQPMLSRNSVISGVYNTTALKPLIWAFLKTYMLFSVGYALVSFCQLSFVRYWSVYKDVYFCGHILFVSWPLTAPYVKKLLLMPRTENGSSAAKPPTKVD